VRAERSAPRRPAEAPDFISLVRAWGGVTIAYRKRMVDSPAYRLNHEEVIKALEEGIAFAENLNPSRRCPTIRGGAAHDFKRKVRRDAPGGHVTLREPCWSRPERRRTSRTKRNSAEHSSSTQEEVLQAHTATANGDGTSSR
jgi:hypothetical protein